MHKDCPHCSFVAVGDSSVVDRILKEHIEKTHTQGYRPSSSWHKCSVCSGSGKNTWGGPCSNCNGSGVV